MLKTETNNKKQKKHDSNKISVKIKRDGCTITANGTVNQMARYTKQVSSEKISVENKIDIPPYELVFEHISKQENYEHSIQSLMIFFFDKYEKSVYNKIYKMAKDTREHIVKKFGGHFRKDEVMSDDDSKRSPKKSIVWSYEPTTSKD